MSRLVAVLIASSPESPMESVAQVRAVPGRGLEGDRYFLGTGTFSPPAQKADYELTLIEDENLVGFARESGIGFGAPDARRNLVTAGIALNELVGREFMIGAVRIRGVRLCEPCNYLAQKTRPEILRGLVHRGGLRAQILTDGVVKAGDAIVVLPSEP